MLLQISVCSIYFKFKYCYCLNILNLAYNMILDRYMIKKKGYLTKINTKPLPQITSIIKLVLKSLDTPPILASQHANIQLFINYRRPLINKQLELVYINKTVFEVALFFHLKSRISKHNQNQTIITLYTHFKDGISDNKVKFGKIYTLYYYIFIIFYIMLYGHTYSSKFYKIITINYGDICL